MLLKGASALYKAPLKVEQIYVFTGRLRCTAKQHVCAQKQISSVTKAPSWPWHYPSSGPMGGFEVSPELVEKAPQALHYLSRRELKCPITCWTLCCSSPCTEMLLPGRELRNTVDLFKRVNLLKLFGNRMWSSALLQNILAGPHMVLVKNSHGISWICQGMLQLFLGGLWSEALAHDLLGSVQHRHVLELWF